MAIPEYIELNEAECPKCKQRTEDIDIELPYAICWNCKEVFKFETFFRIRRYPKG